MRKTKAELVQKINTLQQARQEWLEILPAADARYPNAVVNPDIFDTFGNQAVTANIVDLVNDLTEFINDDQFEPDAYELVLGVDMMLDAWSEWATEVQAARPGDYTYLSRPDAPKAWLALDAIMGLTKSRRYPIPESIERLIAEPNITQNQIAAIYGWYRPDGSYDLDKVKQEIQVPGTHYNPQTWVSPEIERYHQRFAEKWSQRQVKKLINLQPKHDQTERSWTDPPPAPEPIEQLLRMQGMTAQQVASMKKISLEEVYEAAHALGIALDHSSASALYPELGDPINRFKPMAEIQGQIDKIKDSEVSKLKKGNTMGKRLPDRVTELLSENPGLDAGTILRVIQHRYPTATYELVDSIVKTLAPLYEDPVHETFEEPAPVGKDLVIDELNKLNRDQLLATAKDLGLEIKGNQSQLRSQIARHLRSQPV